MKSLFARLTLAHKLLICGAVFFLPTAVLLYYSVSGFEQQIEFTRREMAGVQALQPLSSTAILLAGRQMDSIATGVDSLVTSVRRAESQTGPLLPASADTHVRTIQAANRNPAEVENARVELLREVYATFPNLAESSNLILDPNLESYYLADLALLLTPRLHAALSSDSAALPDPAGLKEVQHAVSVALAESRRRHPDNVSLKADLASAMTTFESSAAPGRLDAVSALWQTAISELRLILDERAARLRRNELIALTLTLAALGLASGLLFMLVRNVSVPLARATRIADQIAAGRVSSAAASLSRSCIQKYVGSRISAGNGHVRDEAIRLWDAFGKMTNSLDSLLGEVRKAYSEVEGSTAEMAKALQQFDSTVAEQTASTAQVAASSKEIFVTADELAQNMREVTGMATEAASLANAGLTGLSEINAAVSDTLDGVASVNRVLRMISTTADSINSVLGAITKIANHTNLISLNAAIEAEKAGEHAAGFTAVALEIRRVADQTAVAALDIEKMLSDMQTAVSEACKSMANYSERSRGNSVTVASITGDLGRSIDCTRKLGPHFEAVNSGMQMQAQSAREIVQAMQQLSTAAGKTRDSLTRFHEIVEHVRSTVGILQSEVSRFSAA